MSDAGSPLVDLLVSPERSGLRLDLLLAEPLGSRARAQRLIDAGGVTVDGRVRPKRHVVSAGEHVQVRDSSPPPAPAAGAGDAPFAIAWEDEHLLVVDKPAGVVVHPARGHRDGTLAQALAARVTGGDDPERAGIVHRLDRDTSGLLVVSRTEQAHRLLREELAQRRIERVYTALVEGRPPSRTGVIDAPIGRDRRDRTHVSLDSDRLRVAVTHFEIAQTLPTTTLLTVHLQTGRTHQIRVHLKAIGYPVCGDPQYGTAGAWGLRRQFLHAARLAFDHPITGERIDVSSQLPEDLQAALMAASAAR